MSSPLLHLWDAKATHVLRRVFKLVVLPVAGAFALLHLVEDVRGARAWSAWKAEQEAAGVVYGLSAPPSLPDADNFATAPRIRESLRTQGGRSLMEGLPPINWQPKGSGTWRSGNHADLALLSGELRGKTLEETLALAAPSLEDLATAVRRPSCSLPSGTPTDPSPAFLGFRQALQALRVRALHHLASGRREAAREDVLTILLLAKHLDAQPTLMNALLQAAGAGLVVQPLWEGLQDHRWTDADLVAFEAALAQVDLLATLHRGLDHERRWQMDLLETLPNGSPFMEGPEAPPIKRLVATLLFPRGWVRQNQVHLDRLWLQCMLPGLDPAAHRYHPGKADQGAEEVQAFVVGSTRNPCRYFAAMLVPALMGQRQRAAEVQTALDEARVACALERHRIARKAYPATLQDLAPGLLARIPTDIPAGGPLRYRTEGTGYVLYALGLDGQDDGGQAVLSEGRWAPSGGDWAWFVK